MMDITKSQSDFEAWVVTWWPQSKTMIAEKFDDGGYWNMPLQQYFEAWKAARESIELVIPPFDGYKDHVAKELQEALKMALRTAGIRIKGESE
ncbi:hypothetical protein [Yersinia intermedia]|uniref:hypothetical protein n=1 Tax=Yersinia intermedia TaxID=631 RepID=UPI0005E1651B|nr:hypothetical protein [Yersinia intermedia]CNE39203.1 Uncharacterised protein [Yersinia intermedia]